MKSVLMVLVACFGLNTWAAQHSAASSSSMNTPKFDATLSDTPIYLIPQIGVAAMTMRGDQLSTAGDTGLSLGGLVDFGRHSLTLETGLLYNQFGGVLGDTKVNLSYLSIPTVAKWNILGQQEETVYLKGGFLTSIKTGASAKSSNGSGNVDGVKTLDFGLLFGVGGTYPVASNTSLVFDVGYLRGLTSVSDSVGGNFRNEGFIFSSGVSIAL